MLVSLINVDVQKHENTVTHMACVEKPVRIMTTFASVMTEVSSPTSSLLNETSKYCSLSLRTTSIELRFKEIETHVAAIGDGIRKTFGLRSTFVVVRGVIIFSPIFCWPVVAIRSGGNVVGVRVAARGKDRAVRHEKCARVIKATDSGLAHVVSVKATARWAKRIEVERLVNWISAERLPDSPAGVAVASRALGDAVENDEATVRESLRPHS